MEDGIHLYGDIGRNGDDRGEIEDPAEEIEGACKEADTAAIFGTWGY